MIRLRELDGKAIVVGAIAGMALGTLYGALSGTLAWALGATPEGLAATSADRLMMGGMLTLGLVFSGIGGHLAARRAKRMEIAHAAMAGLLLVVLSLLFSLLMSLIPVGVPASPTWFAVASYLLTIPAATLGGWLARPRSLQATA
jgi:hypothetical protein